MQRRTFALAAFAFVPIILNATHATAVQRAFVASYGTSGNTSFGCSLTKPCRAFSEALGLTSSGGEVIVLDSAGYGPATISQSVSIIAPAGVHAGISVFAGSNGIDIPGGGIRVVLRGLSISGQGGGHGIYVTGNNELTIERCDIGGMSSNGIFLDGVSGTVQIRDTVVHDNAANGVMLFGALSATLDRVSAERNALAGVYVIDGPLVSMKDGELIRNNRGLEVTNFAALTTRVNGAGMHISRNNHEGVLAITGTGKVFLQLVRSDVNHNPDGGAVVQASASAGDVNATFSDNAFAGNGVGIRIEPPTVGGSASALLVRNVFAEVQSISVFNNGFFGSGGDNSVRVGGAYTAPNFTFSF